MKTPLTGDKKIFFAEQVLRNSEMKGHVGLVNIFHIPCDVRNAAFLTGRCNSCRLNKSDILGTSELFNCLHIQIKAPSKEGALI